MSRIPLVDESAFAGSDGQLLQTTFAEIERELGLVPNLFRAYAQHPELLKLNWEKFKLLMLQGYLSRQLKEAIALVVSEDNHCGYCIYHHSTALENLGVDPKEVLLIRTDPNHAHHIPKDHALLLLARRDNLAPYDHGEKLINNARAQGATDREIVEALGVVEMVAGFNDFADMLALPLE